MTKVKSIWVGLAVFLILLTGFFLRYHNFALVPLPGESTDEYSNTWAGLSLIQIGIPVGRSGLTGYGRNDYRYINVDRIFSTTAGGNPLGINRPWLDHPPLLPLITGGFAYVSGARVFEDARAIVIRKPMIVLGTIAIAVVGYLTWLLFGGIAATLAMALYATSPLMVITSRMIQAENGMLIGFLLTLIFLYKYFESKKRHFLWFSAFCAGLAIMFKVSGVSALICGVIILFTQENKTKRIKLWEGALFLTISGSFLALYFVYGAAFSWTTFMNVWSANSSRPYDIGFGSIFDLLTTTRVTISKRLTEGWPLVGWISLCLLINQKSRKLVSFLVLPVFVYLTVYLLMGGSSYGWYRLPFMPFLFMATAILITKAFAKRDLFMPAFLVMIPVGMTIHKLSEIYQLSWLTGYWRYLLPMLIIWQLLSKTHRLNAAISMGIIILGIVANIMLSYSLTPEYWLKIN